MPNESVDIAFTTWDYALRIWAVAGPLLAAAVGAIWSRHIQVQDREYQNNLQIKREEKQAEERKLIRADELRKEKYDELKDACIEFMTSSHEYVIKQSQYLSQPSIILRDHSREAHDRFTNSNQKIILLGSDELSTASIECWNATIAIPKSYSIPADDEYTAKLTTYQSARTEFNSTAKRQLENLATEQ